MADYTQFLADEAASLAFAQQLAHMLKPSLTVYLAGDLGAGKTTLTRGLLRAWGFEGTVKSPTYTIVESYELDGFKVEHFDLYRFQSPEEWLDAGLDAAAALATMAIDGFGRLDFYRGEQSAQKVKAAGVFLQKQSVFATPT